MSDSKMLQMVLDGQTFIREELKDVKVEVKKNGKRIDKFGLQLAQLDDDAPIVGEFDKLEKRMTKVEKQVASN